MATDSQNRVLESQIRELYGRTVWTHKTHEKCADIILRRHKTIKILQITLSALTTTGILYTVFGEAGKLCAGVVTSLLSAGLFALNTYTKDYDLGEISQKHSSTASDLWNVRESYLSLLTDLKSDFISAEDASRVRDELQEALHNIYNGAPRTINKAYADATEGLKRKEELTFNDEEIDLLLPKSLRSKQE